MNASESTGNNVESVVVSSISTYLYRRTGDNWISNMERLITK